MKFTKHERRALNRIGLRMTRGSVKHFRLWPNSERHTGRDAPMGLTQRGGIADYQILISHVRGEPLYRLKEVSPRLQIVIIMELQGETAFDARVMETAATWGYLATATPGGAATIVRPDSVERDYHPVTSDFAALVAPLKHSWERAKHQAASTGRPVKRERLAATLAQIYEGMHVVFVGAYWEPGEVNAMSKRLQNGVTFCMVESPTLFGGGWFGDALPHIILKGHLSERTLALATACHRSRSNLVIIPRKTGVVKAMETRFLRSTTL